MNDDDTQGGMEVTRAVQFGTVDAALIRDPSLSPTTKAVYAVLATYANPSDRSSYPRRSVIAAHLNVTTKTVDRAIRVLIDAAWLRVDERRNKDGQQRSSLYTLTDLGAAPMTPRVDTHVPGGETPMSPRGETPMSPLSVPGLISTNDQDQRTEILAHPLGEPDDLFSQPLTLLQGQQQPGEPVGWTAWWSLYPRKVGKAKALRAYRAAVKRGATPTFLLAAVQAYPFSSDMSSVPHPSTWLNDSRWEDDHAGLNSGSWGATRVKTDRQWGISTKAELDANGGW